MVATGSSNAEWNATTASRLATPSGPNAASTIGMPSMTVLPNTQLRPNTEACASRARNSVRASSTAAANRMKAPMMKLPATSSSRSGGALATERNSSDGMAA